MMPVFGLQPPGLMETIFEDIGVALFVVDHEETVVFANRTALELFDAAIGTERERFRDLRGKFRYEDYLGNEIPLAESVVMRALKGEPVEAQEVRLKKTNGEAKWLMQWAYRFSYMGLDGVVVLVADETTEVEVRQAAAQLQRMETLGALAAGLTHDFNNVLTSGDLCNSAEAKNYIRARWVSTRLFAMCFTSLNRCCARTSVSLLISRKSFQPLMGISLKSNRFWLISS